MILLDLSALDTGNGGSPATGLSAETIETIPSVAITASNASAAVPALAGDSETKIDEPPAPLDASEASAQAQRFGRYVGQVSARIERAWIRPRSPIAANRFDCQVRIEQDRSGRVLSVELMECNGDADWQKSLVFAIERASPLSAPSDPSVFSTQLVIGLSSAPYVDGVSRDDEYEPANVRLARQQP